MAWGTAQVPWPARLPWMSSVSVLMVTLSTALVLRTTTVKATAPPGSGRAVGLAVLVTVMDDGTSVMLTVALPDGAAVLGSD